MNDQVNIVAKVNSSQVRKDTLNGREHYVIPSYTLPSDVVMNGVLYTDAQIRANYHKLEGKLAPSGHPTVDGKFVSASSPEGLTLGWIGAHNRNVKMVGNRVYLEKWLDVNVAQQTDDGKRIAAWCESAIKGEQVEPIHTSVAVWQKSMPATHEQKSKGGYDYIADIVDFDHDAILLDISGAATPEQGVGMMVHADQAVSISAGKPVVDAGVVTYRQRSSILDSAAQSQLKKGSEHYIWVSDFTDDVVIVEDSKEKGEIAYPYTIEKGSATIHIDKAQKVAKRSFWEPVTNALKGLFTRQPETGKQSKESDDMTPEEKAALAQEVGAIAANAAKEAVTAALGDLTEKVNTLSANQDALAETLTANSKAEEKSMREAVAKEFGELIANSLQGDALQDAFKRIGKPAAIAGNSAETKGEDEFQIPDHETYGGVV